MVLAYQSLSLCVLGTIPVLQGQTITVGISSPQRQRRQRTKHLGGSSLLKETLPLPGDTYWGRRKRERRREEP